ncbi:MAG: molybdopterin-guanine dinucleotide biosynthesis protein B [Anaeromicrobium sp.]|jgi:molybdopterin-guanine dinucleotide biosynthesis protein B|uniref:molybdopterin-guanine dinucleotide biosynthesis protein B n=1 Tax=Anaeromicrobium sp. TaxID=1929132 RepID=UPI0025E4B602|nr:molybdopterin-guanine dinucleotide biosynthesis protein B [Anaeromicrobium sp.]MCT4593294.1 molybdopterin-guanine dinucleotide biosynthesis protein B [Anaeromicrobium sp.]
MSTPIVCVVGKSNVGKTTLVEKLLRELKKRNYKVGTIKHDVHGFNMDKPGKDTWKHAQAGADSVIISSPDRMAMIKKVEKEWSLDELINLHKDMDIIICEGFKRANKPKIEVVRSERSTKNICSSEELIAVASDMDIKIEGVRTYDINDSIGLVDLIVHKIIKR